MSVFGFDEAVSQAVAGISGTAVLAARRSAIATTFRDTVQRLGWTLIENAAVADTTLNSRKFVLGVALWSRDDLSVLEDLASMKWIREKGIPVEVFDIDTILTWDDSSRLLPGVPPFTQTPVLAEYEGRRLVHYHVGKAVSIWCRESQASDPRIGEVDSPGLDRHRGVRPRVS
jgi:hypothetical protein